VCGADVGCVPRRPVDLLFAVDVRAPTATHVHHLWRIAFNVISGIRMDADLVKVTFVPEAPTGRRLADRRSRGYNGDRRSNGDLGSIGNSGSRDDSRSLWRRKLTAEGHGQHDASMTTVNRTTSTSVEEVVKEFVGVIRRHQQLARNTQRTHKDSSTTTGRRRRRIVGVYVTDGRSLDTAGTVYHVDRVTRRLHRSVDMFAVGVGREISGAQLTSVTGGRLDRVLTVFTGSTTKQSYNSLRKLSNRLSRLICRRR